MSDVPTELYHEILLRVPAEQLLRCRCVCKKWRSIIDSPDFTKLHLESQINGAEDLLMVKGTNGKLYSMSLRSLNHSRRRKRIKGLAFRNIIHKSVPQSFTFPAPSCHGFTIITYVRGSRGWALWNPFTGYWLKIQTCKDFVTDADKAFHSGLGYDVSTSDYKVVRVSNVADDSCTSGPYLLKTLIYSLKSNQWHRIDDLPNFHIIVRGIFLRPDIGLYFNGALHWTVFEDRQRKCIVSLDLRTETYNKLPLPSAASKATDCELDALSGCLILFCHDAVVNSFDVWVMKADNKWNKLITFADEIVTFTPEYPGPSRSFEMRAVAYMENERQLVLQGCGKMFLWLDLDTRKGKIMCIKGCGESLFGVDVTCQVFPESLIRLNANPSTRKRMRKPSGNNKLNLKAEFKSFCYQFSDLIYPVTFSFAVPLV